jgi:hypothetical protein
MSQDVTTRPGQLSDLERVVIGGDLSKLSAKQCEEYYSSLCLTLGINPLTQPFEYIFLNGKKTLYAKKNCTDQIRNIRKVSIQITARELHDDVYVVTAKARLPDGREDESTGAVAIGNLKGEARANAMLKAETKAKRRVTLSICGLSMLDDTEVQDIPAKDKNPIVCDQPGENDGVPMDTGYRIPFGKWKARSLEEVGPDELSGYIDYIETKAEKDGKPITGQVAEFLERAKDFIHAFEEQVASHVEGKWEDDKAPF